MILVLFGSFNPITLGHIQCLEVAKKSIDTNTRGLLIPMTDSYPYKKLLSNEHRLNMCRLAIEKHPWIETKIFTDEIHSKEIIDELQTLFPNESLKYVCGTDKIHEFQHWSNQEDVTYIGQKYGFIFVQRENQTYDINILSKYKIIDCSRFINQSFDISSTEVRNKISSGELINNLMDEKVLEYIKKHKLYE